MTGLYQNAQQRLDHEHEEIDKLALNPLCWKILGLYLVRGRQQSFIVQVCRIVIKTARTRLILLIAWYYFFLHERFEENFRPCFNAGTAKSQLPLGMQSASCTVLDARWRDVTWCHKSLTVDGRPDIESINRQPQNLRILKEDSTSPLEL